MESKSYTLIMSARISLYQNKVKKEIEQGNENKKGF